MGLRGGGEVERIRMLKGEREGTVRHGKHILAGCASTCAAWGIFAYSAAAAKRSVCVGRVKFPGRWEL